MIRQNSGIDYPILMSTIQSRVLTQIPRLAIVGGVFSVLFGLLVLGLLTKTSSPNQDIRSRAIDSAAQPKASLGLKPKGEFVTGQLGQLEMSLNLENQQLTIDGLQLAFQLPKEYFQQPQLVISPDWPTKIGFIDIKENQDEYLIKLILIHKNPGQPLKAIANSTPIINLYFTARKAGTANIKFLPQSLATLYQSQPTQNILNISPTNHFVIKPASSNENKAVITFPFTLQGLTKSNVTLATKVWFEPIADDIEKGGNNPSRYELESNFISDEQGWLKPQAPIDITTLLTKNPYRQRYQVLVKTPVSLRKKIGQFDLEPGNWQITIVKNAYSRTWSNKPVLVGDFVQTGDNYNVLNISDVVAIKDQYTNLAVPITPANAKFDVNYDGKIDILDPGLVLSNWIALFNQGD